jgi:tetratricopeptide (TPR) repeat protein
VDPAEWNAHAWKLASDSDPTMRDPTEAVRLAELAVAADPKNAVYVRTLGVARYRAGDFTAAIEALKRSIDAGGFNARNAFFLAMAHARLGDREEAGQWYLQANRWTRQKQTTNAELRRFREEAAAVLDVADDKRRGPQRAPNAPPLSKDARPGMKPE